ncbi:hypothetical protein GPECTOR_232g531 [Gonium pectorale]|uniref:Uncharacterized protein n=1 Tax=Gonium pectorale TaxID=33097 RepID=A0A150FWI1_GONPE|nr:hypothetical protein GPECTOR_232g531 [Gonium pectorale]|eukprot:KXZ41972.1 hypothetical protein GPECTOR_232g531 [Gonium pectorale]
MTDRATATHSKVMGLWIENLGGLVANDAIHLIYDFGIHADQVLQLSKEAAIDALNGLQLARANRELVLPAKRPVEDAANGAATRNGMQRFGNAAC